MIRPCLHHLWGGRTISVEAAERSAFGMEDYIAREVASFVRETLLPEAERAGRKPMHVAVSISLFCEDDELPEDAEP